MINPKKFHERVKLFNDILYEIFKVESNYRTDLSVLNLKLVKKIEDHKNSLNKTPKLDKLRQSLKIKNNLKDIFKPKKLLHNNSEDSIFEEKKDDTDSMYDKLLSEALQHLLTFYKGKHKLISKEVSSLGIILYNFSSQKKAYENDNTNDLEKNEKDFQLYYSKLMKSKNKYFDKMNELERFFHNNIDNNKNSNKNINKINDEPEVQKEKIDKLIHYRQKYKSRLDQLNNCQRIYVTQINELCNMVQEFNINENDILYNIFKVFDESLSSLSKEVSKYYELYENNKKLILDLNVEFGNNVLVDDRINSNFQFEEYNPMFKDLNNKKDLSVIQKMNNLVGFEFDKFKSNKDKNSIGSVINEDTDNNVLFILLMDKFFNVDYQLNEKEKKLLKGLFNQAQYINDFLKKLNNVRSNKKLFGKKEKFILLSDLFNIIYKKVSFGDENKHELVKFLMILSETFFYKEEDKKIFLNSVIEIPAELTNDVKFWIRYIDIEIENEFKNYNNNKKKSTKYEYIVLLSNLTHLREYMKEKEKLEEIISYFKDKYNFSNDDVEVVKSQLKI
jgi:hypothetical protein